jgi:predicted transposase/invertase (TIGR01784 family)
MLEDAWETGLLEGEAKGEARGIIKGKAKGRRKIEGKIEIVLNCFAQGIQTAFISKITGFSEEEVIDILKAHESN